MQATTCSCTNFKCRRVMNADKLAPHLVTRCIIACHLVVVEASWYKTDKTAPPFLSPELKSEGPKRSVGMLCLVKNGMLGTTSTHLVGKNSQFSFVLSYNKTEHHELDGLN